MNTDQRKIAQAFNTALQSARTEYPSMNNMAEGWAWDKFHRQAINKVSDPRFDAQAPGYARLCLLEALRDHHTIASARP